MDNTLNNLPLSYGREIILAAQTQAQRVQEESIERIAAARTQALKEGFEEGLTRICKLLDRLEKQNVEYQQALEREAVDLAIKIAEEVIGDEITTNPDSIIARIARATNYTKHCSTISLIINPAHEERLRELLSEFQLEQASSLDFRIISDHNLPLQQAILDTPQGKVISDPVEHFDSIKQQLRPSAVLNSE